MKRYQMMGLAALLLSGLFCSTVTWAQIPPSPGVATGRQIIPLRPTGLGGLDRDRRSRGRGGGGGNSNVTVIYPDNGYGYGNWNNSNYLGYPPWYRLNYYTPWMSDYQNSTAWRNIPSSHAGAAFGLEPDSVTARAAAYNAQATAAASLDANVDFVVAVQRELRTRGYYRGVINGLSDAPTRAAIRAYESANSMPVTGIIGGPLLRSLGFF